MGDEVGMRWGMRWGNEVGGEVGDDVGDDVGGGGGICHDNISNPSITHTCTPG